MSLIERLTNDTNTVTACQNYEFKLTVSSEWQLHKKKQILNHRQVTISVVN